MRSVIGKSELDDLLTNREELHKGLEVVIDMLKKEIAAGTPFRYLCGDCGYGRDPDLRAFCHDRRIGYVPADLPLIAVGGGSEPVGHLLDRLLAHGNPAIRKRRSCGQGTKGTRLYGWTCLPGRLADQQPAPGHTHTVLIRRSVTAPAEIEFFLAHTPLGTPITDRIKEVQDRTRHSSHCSGQMASPLSKTRMNYLRARQKRVETALVRSHAAR